MICGSCGSKTRRTTTIIRDKKAIDWCPECPRAAAMTSGNHHRRVSTFPFTMEFPLEHGGEKITFSSLRQLRKTEARLGIQSQIYNQSEKSCMTPSRQEPRRMPAPGQYGGREAAQALMQGRGDR